jgi:hypothetical protein
MTCASRSPWFSKIEFPEPDLPLPLPLASPSGVDAAAAVVLFSLTVDV